MFEPKGRVTVLESTFIFAIEFRCAGVNVEYNSDLCVGDKFLASSIIVFVSFLASSLTVIFAGVDVTVGFLITNIALPCSFTSTPSFARSSLRVFH